MVERHRQLLTTRNSFSTPKDRSMMSDPASVLRRLLATLVGVFVLAGATAVAADASYGEVGRFGSEGTGPGQLSPGESHAIGVNPENNDVFVVDQPNPAKENEFRIQEFEATEPGKYKVVASVNFKPHDDEGEEEADQVEGVAVDPKLKRVYVLASETRRPTKVKISTEVEAASQLYAFSSEASGGKLLPASGTSKVAGEEGVLAGTSVLQPLSKDFGVSLLEPQGIAVDESDGGDVIIAGHEEKTEGDNQVAVQQVKPNGELGERWFDEKEVLEDIATSPAVSATGKIYIDNFNVIDEIPSSFSDSAEATPLAPTNFNELIVDEQLAEELVEFPGQPEPESGGALSIGEEGTIYTKAGIARQFDGTDFKEPGVLEFNSSGEEEGWTGGQSVAAVGKTGPCKLSFAPAIQIAAGKDHTVFAYDTGEFGPAVVEFGPGGSGCAMAEATPPEATVDGLPVSETEKIPLADAVTLSSTITQANALSVTWKFSDGTEQTVPGRQYQHIEVTHKFAEAGLLPVKAIIHTDDLADPEVEVKSNVDIVGPEAVTGPAEKIEESSATLTGSVNPNEAEVKECFFEYGTSTSYGQTAQCKPKASELTGDKSIPVSAPIASLSKETTYDFRLVVKYGASGENKGANKTFKTAESATNPKPSAITGSASAIAKTSASLSATVDPQGVAVKECKFVYGLSTSYEHSVPCKQTAAELGSGTSAEGVTAEVTGLNPETPYHFAIVATNVNGEGKGSDASFTTEKEASGPPKENTNTNTNPGSPPGNGVLGIKTAETPAEPIATLAGNPTSVSGSGTFTLKVTCPERETACIGTLSLKTLKAVVASVGHEAKSKAAILTLASASFTVAGGKVETVTLHLSSKGRALLAHTHSVSARVTIVAHDASGKTHTTTAVVTLRPAPAKKHHH
jgi:hypothetical protein